MIKAVIFDMDGVLVDTEPIHFEANKRAMKHQGIDLKKEDYLRWGFSKDSRGFYERLTEKYGVDLDFDTTHKMKLEHFSNLVQEMIQPRPGVKELLSLLEGKYPLALASANSKENIDKLLTETDLKKHFRVILSGGNVKRNKPFPDVYLEAAKRLRVRLENCLVIEDSDGGVEAVKAAGMKVIAVLHDFNLEVNLEKADLTVENLSDIDLDLIEKM